MKFSTVNIPISNAKQEASNEKKMMERMPIGKNVRNRSVGTRVPPDGKSAANARSTTEGRKEFGQKENRRRPFDGRRPAPVPRQEFTAAYDEDDEIKISRFRRERLHGDEAVNQYVIGRKPSIGVEKPKKEPARPYKRNKKK